VVVKRRRPRSGGPRQEQRLLYVGNLPQECENLESKLVSFLEERAQVQIVVESGGGGDGTTNKDEESALSIHRSKDGWHALVPCAVAGENLDDVVRKLHRSTFEGKKLVVRREGTRKPDSRNPHSSTFRQKYEGNPTASSFGRSWSKPSSESDGASRRVVVVDDAGGSRLRPRPRRDCIGEVSERIAAVVSAHTVCNDENDAGGGCDSIARKIASTAAVTMVLDGLALADSGEVEGPDQSSTVPGEKTDDPVKSEQQAPGTRPDEGFHAQQTPLADLLAEYGEQDVSWMKQAHPADSSSSSLSPIEGDEGQHRSTGTIQSSAGAVNAQSRLGQHGKCPIHVDFVSFGYRHGAPPEVAGGGWSRAHPLPPFDTRSRNASIPTVPPHLAWQDGLSGAVKRALLYPQQFRSTANHNSGDPDAGKDAVKDFAALIAEHVAAALEEAVDVGGHGYASPLRMQIFVGSDLGRHRSVVVAEKTATKLRSLLRTNRNDRFKQPCSVGTRHRDVELKRARDALAKPKNDEDD